MITNFCLCSFFWEFGVQSVLNEFLQKEIIPSNDNSASISQDAADIVNPELITNVSATSNNRDSTQTVTPNHVSDSARNHTNQSCWGSWRRTFTKSVSINSNNVDALQTVTPNRSSVSATDTTNQSNPSNGWRSWGRTSTGSVPVQVGRPKLSNTNPYAGNNSNRGQSNSNFNRGEPHGRYDNRGRGRPSSGSVKYSSHRHNNRN